MKNLTTIMSAYSPQADDDEMEGGYESSRRGPDGKFLVRTLVGIRNGAYDYVTLAGHPDWYNTKFIIPEISFLDKNNEITSLKNVKAVVHDTGSAFKNSDAKDGRRFDLAVGRDLPSRILDKQPWSMREVKMVQVDSWEEYLPSNEKMAKEVVEPISKGLPWFETAKSLIGTDEVPGSRDNEDIMEWAEKVNVDDDYTADSIPWCGLFVAYCLVANGIKASKSPLWALSWNSWGMKLDEPALGCIMVFKRTGGGHVGFYVSEDSSTYHILGGNQSDTVSITRIEKSRCVGYRWPTGKEDLLKKGRIKKSFSSKISTDEQ